MNKMIKIILAQLILLPMTMSAQSTDATYPIGHWWNMPPGESEEGIYVDIDINRGPESPQNGNNWNECGTLEVSDNKTEKTLLEATLFYDGKGLKGDMASGVYYFRVRTPNGQTSRLGIRRVVEKENDSYMVSLKFESITGALQNHAFLKESLYSAPGAMGHYADNTPEANTEQELLQVLRESERDAAIYGFGNRQQYVTAHARLDPAKPKYAKPKGTSAINIRERGISTAPKVGELQPGQTLVVVDEYNGWCQVRIAEKKYGWVSLSVVTLTNTPGSAASMVATPTPAPAPALAEIKGEVGAFELRGPVKECFWDHSDYQTTLTFDQNGMWKTRDGQVPWAGQPVKRDTKGRIIHYGDGDIEEMFTYNAKGQCIVHGYHDMEYGYKTYYSYNQNGEVTQVKDVDWYDNVESNPRVTKFTVLARDSYGNWTKRKNPRGRVETRKISYY